MSEETGKTRRGFLVAAGAAVAGAYGTLAWFMGRFVYPSGSDDLTWMYVTSGDRVPHDEALVYRTPSGAVVNIARRVDDPSRIMALSSTCPHLGCQVHWQPHNERFFCPCHNGVFDPEGRPISGPPADADQPLVEYPLEVRDGLLYIGLDRQDIADGGSGRVLSASAVERLAARRNRCCGGGEPRAVQPQRTVSQGTVSQRTVSLGRPGGERR